MQPLFVIMPSLEVIVIPPQASVEVAVPNAALITAGDGLQPSVFVVPVGTTTRMVPLLIHVTVLDAVAVLPQASLAMNVLVCERPQLVLTTVPSL